MKRLQMSNSNSGTFSFRGKSVPVLSAQEVIAMRNQNRVFSRTLSLFSAAFFFSTAWAESQNGVSSCEGIANQDLQLFCKANRSQNTALCGQISDPRWNSLCTNSGSHDLYACDQLSDQNFAQYCYAIQQKTSIPCFEIQDENMEFLCYSHVQNTTRFCMDVKDPDLNQLCLGLYAAGRVPPRPPR
jgi:hypothetical protein